jgi:hypothetical protein
VGYSDYQREQIVTAGMYGTLDRVNLILSSYTDSPPSGSKLIVSIQTVIGGLPSGKQIGIGYIALDAIPPYKNWVDVDIRGTSLSTFVQPGTQYAIVLQTSVWNADVNWWYAYQNQYGSSYTRGAMAHNFGSGWSIDGMYDFAFETYVVPDVLDQSQTAHDLYGVDEGNYKTLGQIFTAGMSGVLSRVAVWLDWGWNPYEGSIVPSIQTVNEAGFPSGTIIWQGASIPSSSLPNGFPGGWVYIPISGVTVTAGTKYAIVLSGSTVFLWYWTYTGEEDPDPMVKYNGEWSVAQGWTATRTSAFQTYIYSPFTFSPPPLPTTITPCSSGVCPAASGSITPPDSTARVTSNVQFKELPNGKIQGILNFNDSRTGDFVLKGCTTTSTACRLTVETFACTDQNSITVVGTYTPKGETTGSYRLALSGTRDEIGTFTLTAGDYTYTLTHEGIADVTCPQ